METSTHLATDRILSALDRIDWNFPGASTPSTSIHSLHWFPGNYIPQIPSFLIQILSKEGDMVFDPFCGSGTTGIEAVVLGRDCIQSDINPASIQVSQGKWAILRDEGIWDKLTQFQDLLIWDFVPPDYNSTMLSPSENVISNWFHPETFAQLRYIWGLVESVYDRNLGLALKLLFTDVLFSCASSAGGKTSSGKPRRHHWGWIADNVLPRERISHNAISMFRERLVAARTVADNLPRVYRGTACLIQANALQSGLADGSVDCIVTSPPYIGMIDYTLASRLTYEWMRWDMEASLRQEIGARRHRNRKSALSDYLEVMESALLEFRRVLRPDGYCALVIGASRKFPSALTEIERLFRANFELIWGPRVRQASRRRISERQGSENNEYIYVLRNL